MQSERSTQGSAHAPQSDGHDVHVSLPLQLPSPQRGAQAPQSWAQLVQFSPEPQVPSPHDAGHGPQSRGHVEHDSASLQVPSPQPRFGPVSVTVGRSVVVTGTSRPGLTVPVSVGVTVVPSVALPASVVPVPVLKLPRALHAAVKTRTTAVRRSKDESIGSNLMGAVAHPPRRMAAS